MDTLPTNQGPMTAEEIGEHLMYASWKANRGMCSEKTLRGFYGDVPHEQFTAKYIRENRK